MAVQVHVAHSAMVKGAAAIAGGPYYCAMGSVWTAYFNCTTPGWWTPLPRAALLKSLTDGFAQSGRIDATTHLAGAPVWLFSGTNDHTVLPEVETVLPDHRTKTAKPERTEEGARYILQAGSFAGFEEADQLKA